jgi:Asp-tRNA(Asn)/Glu-tRNA(Gln) amidotransferase A subunit family amidase
VFEYYQKRIEQYDETLQSYNFVNTDGLSNDASDTPLAGIPLGIKDIFCER